MFTLRVKGDKPIHHGPWGPGEGIQREENPEWTCTNGVVPSNVGPPVTGSEMHGSTGRMCMMSFLHPFL